MYTIVASDAPILTVPIKAFTITAIVQSVLSARTAKSIHVYGSCTLSEISIMATSIKAPIWMIVIREKIIMCITGTCIIIISINKLKT